MTEIDYSKSGMTVYQALMERLKRNGPDPRRDNFILWEGLRIKAYDWWDVGRHGRVRIELMSYTKDI